VKDIITKILQNLPQILSVLPQIIKWVPILVILAGLGYGGYLVLERMPPLYVCAGNQTWEWKFGSNVYTFVGETCIDGSKVDQYQ
jgi:hypothetical protein